MDKCYTSTTPSRIEDPCEGNQTSTDCSLYPNSIVYLGLPANSTSTVVIQALLTSLVDARNRITALENRIEDHETRITALENV